MKKGKSCFSAESHISKDFGDLDPEHYRLCYYLRSLENNVPMDLNCDAQEEELLFVIYTQQVEATLRLSICNSTGLLQLLY